jgi:hypothetical protein
MVGSRRPYFIIAQTKLPSCLKPNPTQTSPISYPPSPSFSPLSRLLSLTGNLVAPTDMPRECCCTQSTSDVPMAVYQGNHVASDVASSTAWRAGSWVACVSKVARMKPLRLAASNKGCFNGFYQQVLSSCQEYHLSSVAILLGRVELHRSCLQLQSGCCNCRYRRTRGLPQHQ